MEYMQQEQKENAETSEYVSMGIYKSPASAGSINRDSLARTSKSDRNIPNKPDYSLRYIKKNNTTQNRLSYHNSPVYKAAEYDKPIQMQKGEPGSVFDFQKLRDYLRGHIILFGKRSNAWLGRKLSDQELDDYTERVQTLFEDIRQVDLQFLNVINASYGENGRTAYNTVRPELYKPLIEERLSYMYWIRDKLVSDRKNLSEQDPKRATITGYLRDVGRLIKFLKQVIRHGDTNGYVFNINTLLQSAEDNQDVEAFMVIPAPSTDTYKDIYIDDDRRVATSSTKLQMGIGTPIRAFSWFLKYLLNSDEGIHNPPLIRSFKIPQRVLDHVIFEHMVSETHPQNNGNPAPMNEDFKVENQFNIPTALFADILSRIPDAPNRLETIGVSQKTPTGLMRGAGTFVELDDFKKRIGFARKKKSGMEATDIHFFDFEHTAFFHVNNGADRTRAELYTPDKLTEECYSANELMDNIVLRFGTNKVLTSKTVESLSRTLNDNTLDARIRILLEANHCLPTGRSHDLKGNDVTAMEAEKEFASSLFREDGTDERIRSLLTVTFNRLEILLNSTNKTRNKYTKKIRGDSGLLYEYQNLCTGYEPAPDLSTLLDYSGFNQFRGFINKVSKEKKLEVTAFALKLLRIIMQKDQTEQQRANEEAHKALVRDDNELEEQLFARRMTGDHFDAINMRNTGNEMSKRPGAPVPFDKMTSTGRFVPMGGKPKHSFAPFVGGASGTTRDISADLMSHGLLTDEKEYWNFQLLNSAFMISYSYHSFIEVIFRAASERRKLFGEETISTNIINYLKLVSEQKNPVKSSELIRQIRRIIA